MSYTLHETLRPVGVLGPDWIETVEEMSCASHTLSDIAKTVDNTPVIVF